MRPLQRLPKGRATRGSKAPEQLARGRTPTKFELYGARRGSCTIASEPGGFGVGEC
jgi:hypothetical protein